MCSFQGRGRIRKTRGIGGEASRRRGAADNSELKERFRFCNDCKVPFRTVSEHKEHDESEEHSRVLKLRDKGIFSFSWSPIVVDNAGRMECRPCNFQYRKLRSWLNHLNTRKHLQKVACADPRLRPLEVKELIE